MRICDQDAIARHIEELQARSEAPRNDLQLQMQEQAMALWTIALLLSRDSQIKLTTTVEDVRRRELEEALQATNFNRREAAKLLGLSYRTIINRCKQFHLGHHQRGDDGDR